MLSIDKSFLIISSDKLEWLFNDLELDKVEENYGTRYAIKSYPKHNKFIEASY